MMLEKLLQADRELFLTLNGARNAFLDFFMFHASNALSWFPLYIIFFYLLIKAYRKDMVYILLFVGLCVTLTDQMSVHFFKNVFLRLRPCHEPELAGLVHILNGKCGGQYGFVSSHAANFGGIGTLLGLMLLGKFRLVMLWVPLWVFIIGYSRIYLGVHYPLDVLCGWTLGICTGLLLFLLFRWLRKRWPLEKSVREISQ